MIRLILIALLLLASPAAAQQVPQTRGQIAMSFSPVVKQTAPAVVNIYAKKIVQGRRSPFEGDPFFERFFRGLGGRGFLRERVENSLGSGVIVSAEGLIVSNHHVVGGASEIRVVLSDRREYDAQILISDADTDIAVLRLLGAADLSVLPLADSDAVEVGDLVLAIGNPFGVGQTVTSGIVSGLARSTSGPRGEAGYFIQTDAAINPGNSGGALVDMAGRLVGVNTAILTRSGGSNGIGFAVPANLVRQVIAQAAAGGDAFQRPWVGFLGQAVDAEIAESLGLSPPKGILVKEIHPLSPFAMAGVATGDVITGVDGVDIDSMQELEFRLSALGVGAAANAAILRAGAAYSAGLSLIAPPEIPPRQETPFGQGSPLAGLTVANLNPGLADELDLSPLKTGIIVTRVARASRLSGFRPGDLILAVNGAPVADVAALGAMIATARDWRFTVDRNGRIGDIAFRN